jgi:hypothetical protein
MSDLDLMRQVFTKANGGTIRQAAMASGIPEAFLAALVANESGGDYNAKRFEPRVLSSLWEVLLGRKAHFGSIGRDDIRQYIVPAGFAVDSANSADVTGATRTACDVAMQRLDSLATSWGLTQIMGYQVLPVGKKVDVLRDPAGNLDFACALLKQFAVRFQLEWGDTEKLFRCWNTGSPSGETFDPNYAANGLARMALWPQVLQIMGAAQP